LHLWDTSPASGLRYSVRHVSDAGADATLPTAKTKAEVAAKAKLLVVLLAFAWGLNWVAAAFALREVSPWSLRFAGSSIGAATLFIAAILTGHKLRVPRGEHIHIMVAGLFNVAGFQILSGFAQLSGATTRAIIITYSMPIWTTALSWLVLGERLNRIGALAFALCVAGLTILVWPLFADGFPPFVFYSLGCAWSWAFATVYIKWVKVTIEPLANAAWQLLFGFLFVAAGSFLFEGYPHLWPLHQLTVYSILFVGLFGVGLAHFLWWTIVGRLPAITASIGALLVPVIGVSASTVILGERMSAQDIIGFVLIFVAAACVLLPQSSRRPEPRA
jgi:drug/metabolite transporter (DMT)-like permease